ncbi:SDR family NAD(P)-dependent oxidoreductase [Paenibacillus sp. PAMC21692]|jgi:NAD(P)-dependent dehydrogenase (short-subunit alcohol dehydrogenase family)|uniref:SDR family NAD(P)-dependent oxidoreductase n=1 Tax=Paenibacillus sp. PAMC21692 TaxID=2762320 RepID=UPI00164E7183|nr:SDR family NAD(P)-dependent oxidoreductase [Paenibacillus sp. PAMC21692]QNK59578.1 SDR family oxidoreductase [Paenibacillus sp. PAMC21692]
MLLAGKKALITGAAGNLGGEISERLASEGCTVLLADRNGPAVEAEAERLVQRGYRAEAAVMDVTDETAVKQAFAGIEALDILINSAGMTRGGFVENLSLQQWNDMLNVNLTSVFLCSKYAMPLLSKSEAPAIVNMSSINAFRMNPGFPAYAAAKNGIIALTEQLAIEGAKYRIRANCVSPGGVLNEAKQRNRENDAEFDIHRDCYPPGRLAFPADIANAVLFLASDLSAFVNGINLVVDGGMTLLAATALVRPDLRKRWRKGVYKLESEE